jgi:hypothetical protein
MYGESGAAMRTEFAALLRQHRVQQKLRGPTRETRADLGLLIREYRQSVLVWMNQAMRAAQPLVFSNLPAADPNPFRSVGSSAGLTPAGELARTIDSAVQQSAARIATFEELTTPSLNAMVEHWRLAARGAALAEHDTSAEVAARMTAGQARALVGDIAALTQALVVLDRRYIRVPGWEPLADSPRLGWASLAAALDVSLGQPDYAVDRLGWRPWSKVMRDPVRPGVLGVLQAEHNLVIRMKTTPSVANLRLVVDSQRLLSHHLAPLAARISPVMADRWADREETYSLLQRQLRDIGGLLGKGGLAAAEGAKAVARVRALPADTIVEPRVLSGFHLLFDRLDHRIADVIETGIERGTFVQRVTLPRLVEGDGRLVQPVRERFVPVASATDLAVVRTARQRLRPRASIPATTPGATRVDLHLALIHRPVKRGSPDAPGL